VEFQNVDTNSSFCIPSSELLMSQGSRPERVADQIRSELALLLAREVHDPGLGFVTITRVQVTPDLQHARVYYTALGDDKAQGNSGRALQRASPFLRRQIGSRLRLKRVAELEFVYDRSIAGQDRIEQLLSEIRATQTPVDSEPPAGGAPSHPDSDDDQS
jgi:ribosome-binding factor A